jgi:hypothetical protein
MGLPYPILNEGGAVVVDSAKAGQIAYNTIFERLDSAQKLMDQRKQTLASDYDQMRSLAEQASVLDESDVNYAMQDTRDWYAAQADAGRPVNSPQFIKEFNQRMLGVESLAGKAKASRNAYDRDLKALSQLDGYWNKDQMMKRMIENRAVPLAERKDDLLPELMEDAQYYDIDRKMADVRNVYRQGMDTVVEGFERDGDNWKFSRTWNPAVHQIEIDPVTGKEYVKYEVTPESYSQHVENDEGLRKSIDAEASKENERLLIKMENIADREAAGQIVPENEQLTEWEQEFVSRGSGKPGLASMDQSRLIFSQKVKEGLSYGYQEFKTGITAEKKLQMDKELLKDRAQTKPDTEGAIKRQLEKEEQDNFFRSVATGNNPEKAMNDIIKERESGGGIVKGQFRTEDIGDGIIKVTYQTRSKNEYNYKNIIRQKELYFDKNNRGSVLNAFNKIGEKGWDIQPTDGERELPPINETIIREEKKEGATQAQFESEGGTGGGKLPPGA